MRSKDGLRVGLAAGIALIGASACAGNSRQTDLAYIERPVETIYNEAVRTMERNLWQPSAAQFDEVQRQHPDFLIVARRCQHPGIKINGTRQHKTIVIVGMFANQIDPARRLKHSLMWALKMADKSLG